MGFIEYADGTVYDPEIEREKREALEKQIKDANYRAHMQKVLESAAQNHTPFTVTPLYFVEDYDDSLF